MLTLFAIEAVLYIYFQHALKRRLIRSFFEFSYFTVLNEKSKTVPFPFGNVYYIFVT